MLAGRGQFLAVDRPNGRVGVGFGRTGVSAAGSSLVGFPFWLATRLRWELGPRTWTVKIVTSGRFKALLSRTLEELHFADSEEGRLGALRAIHHVEEGRYDDLLRLPPK